MDSGARSIGPLGANGNHGRRALFHHFPLAMTCVALLALFTTLPVFDVSAYEHADLMAAVLPQTRTAAPAEGAHGGARRGQGTHVEAGHGGEHDRMMGHARHGRAAESRPMPHGDGELSASRSRTVQQLTVATGYVGVGLLALALLLGPANLVLRRRNPVSTYLRRDVGIWTAVFSIVHVMLAVAIHVSHGSGVLTAVLHFFVAENGRPLTNSFGWGNWTGLAALVIVVGLLATSSDAALRTLKARPWKWLQRLTYALFLLVVLHAVFYGALLRMTSPFTRLLLLSVAAVVVGQLVGVWLWRRRHVSSASVA
jgi:sulfoxide reductase heme-binding subunit YedZ